MHLSFLIYSYFPFGGLQRDFLRVAKECLSRGHNITVYTLSWDGDIPMDKCHLGARHDTKPY